MESAVETIACRICFICVADCNTLMLLNVYITHECLPVLMAQIPFEVSLKSEFRSDGIGVMRSGVKLYCMQRCVTSSSTRILNKLILLSILN